MAKAKLQLRSAAMTEQRYAANKPKMKKVTVYPKVEMEAADIPELVGKPTGYECMVTMKVKKVNEGLGESWNLPAGERPKNMVKFEVIGTMKHKPKSLKEEMDERKTKAGY